ncbi:MULTISPECIES: GGDEF domain-containing protein [unclassified Sedimentibacter]|uniref:GGDEF domain-containing protein n=1 Tax=unclassified Sedimentibacter TaxID=2649220 RepID=UPI0027E14C0C|nr:GGDEF domain-containing protein [Sedimentibacter sp. MB35-C1]WMJ77892.1 GGDEF domain-containing protein [Sedimentibacter sp. MB35-C1]
MANLIENLNDYDLMKKAFNHFRLIDFQHKKIVSEHSTNSHDLDFSEIDYSDFIDTYKKCIELDCTSYKIKQLSNCLCLFVLLPVKIKECKYILECSANIKEAESHGFCNTLENTYKLSITDELTGVYNRRYINLTLPDNINGCARNELPLSVIFTDLDFFKNVNDSYGHSAGDYLLSQFAIELKQSIRQSTDWVARYGGDEFLICLVGADNKKAEKIAERIRESIEKKSLIYRGKTLKTTCSFGIYTVDNFDILPTYESILNEVDKQLYKAKNCGRNQIK